MVPDVDKACQRFEQLGVEFVKKPNDGKMKGKNLVMTSLSSLCLSIISFSGLAFIKDPDNYWIEILNCNTAADRF